jgi:hypothetical protein
MCNRHRGKIFSVVTIFSMLWTVNNPIPNKWSNIHYTWWINFIVMGCRLEGRGSILSKGQIFFSSPQCPYWLWGSHTMDTQCLVPRWKILELYLYSLIHIHGIVLSYLSTGITLPLPFNTLLHLCVGSRAMANDPRGNMFLYIQLFTFNVFIYYFQLQWTKMGYETFQSEFYIKFNTNVWSYNGDLHTVYAFLHKNCSESAPTHMLHSNVEWSLWHEAVVSVGPWCLL